MNPQAVVMEMFLQYIRDQPFGLYDPSSDIIIPYHEQKTHMLMSIFERSGLYKAELRNMTKGRKKKR